MIRNVDIGARVRACRRARDWTQKELAARCGCHYQIINGLERGRQSVYAERLADVAVALGVSTDYLLGLSPILERRGWPVPPLPGGETDG